MEVSFVAQPFADGRDLRDFLASIAADDTIDELDVVVAWAKRSGLRRVRAGLELTVAADERGKPPCCDDTGQPPADEEIAAIIAEAIDLRARSRRRRR